MSCCSTGAYRRVLQIVIWFGALATATRAPLEGQKSDSVTIPADKYAVIVDLDLNELRFMNGHSVLWKAPVGTGTGLRLESDQGEWVFDTPRGRFEVQYKELDPVWNVPDWYYIKNKLPIPPEGDPERRQPGQLGAAAIYIGNDLALHGTDKPELLGQRVSHGCIRLSDEDVLRLFHNVQRGTPVYIIGGEGLTPDSVRALPPAPPQPYEADLTYQADWSAFPTQPLLKKLDADLWSAAQDPLAINWVEVTRILLDRATLKGDDRALYGLLGQAGLLEGTHLEQEYATFLAEGYLRAPERVISALAEMGDTPRRRAALSIVSAVMGLYPGSHTDQVAPWPTRSLPEPSLNRANRPGWEALRDAEHDYRRLQRLPTIEIIHPHAEVTLILDVQEPSEKTAAGPSHLRLRKKKHGEKPPVDEPELKTRREKQVEMVRKAMKDAAAATWSELTRWAQWIRGSIDDLR